MNVIVFHLRPPCCREPDDVTCWIEPVPGDRATWPPVGARVAVTSVTASGAVALTIMQPVEVNPDRGTIIDGYRSYRVLCPDCAADVKAAASHVVSRPFTSEFLQQPIDHPPRVLSWRFL